MTETNQPQTWRKERMYGARDMVLWAITIGKAGEDSDFKVIGSALEEVDADQIIADHAAAAKLADAEAEIERLKQSDEHHNQLATDYFKNWQDALADRDALAAALEQIDEAYWRYVSSSLEVPASRELVKVIDEALRKHREKNQ